MTTPYITESAVKPLPQPQSSVPPRFKRNGMELHAVKRASPPKEPSPGKQAGSAGGGAGENSDKGSVDAATPSSYSSRASSTRKSPGCWDRQSTGSSTGMAPTNSPQFLCLIFAWLIFMEGRSMTSLQECPLLQSIVCVFLDH